MESVGTLWNNLRNMSCFLCDLETSETHKIVTARTLFRDTPLQNVLYDFISKYFEVEIDDEDIVCDTCAVLLDALDRLRFELEHVEHMLQLQITRKYKLSERQVCRLDERTAKRYSKGSRHRFACVECAFETDFADCLMPHSWRHEHHATFSGISPSPTELQLSTDACFDCNLAFSTDELLRLHLEEFHDDAKNTGMNTTIDVASPGHLEIVVDVEDYDGDYNGEAAIINATPPTNLLQCEKCLENFHSRRELQHHLRSIHFFCGTCNTRCRNEITLRGHIRRQHTKHVCDKCGKVLSSLSSHRAHQATHGIDLKYKCPHCAKGFHAKSLLDTHIVVHTKEFNFTCHICGQKFIHRRTLRLHIEWHTNPRPHKCPHCDKTYKHISHLAVHRRVHSGELPKACQFCDKRFASASKLKFHMVKHTGVYSHPCQQCNRGFMKRYKLAEHMFSAHGDNTMLLNKPKCEYKMMVRPELLHHRSDAL